MEKKIPPLRTVWHAIEDGLCYLALICLALLPAAEGIARLVFKTGVPASSGFMVHLLLLVGLLSGMITTKKGEHLSIVVVQNFCSENIKGWVSVFTSLLSTFVLTMVTFSAMSFMLIALSPWRLIGFIPDQVFALIIPVGYGVMALRFARNVPVKGAARILPVLVLLLGVVCSIPMIGKIIEICLYPPPGNSIALIIGNAIGNFVDPDKMYVLLDKIYEITEFFYIISYYIKTPAVILFIFAALAGTPLFVVMGGSALILIQSAGGEIDVVANQVYTTLTNDSFIAIPLFTLMGFFLSESKAGERLVHTFRSLFSWLPGGMIIATVILCAFFTSFTGASGVTILALGGILYTILGEVKYPKPFSIGLLTSVGSIGLLFPPSLPIILVGTASMTNIFHVFLGGLLPGVVLIIAVIIFSLIASRKTKIPVERFNLRKALLALKNSIFEILLPVFLIIGYFSGILSLIEIGAAGVIYIFIVEVVINRDIKVTEIPKVFSKAVPIMGGVLSILALSQAVSYFIVDTQIPEQLVRWMLSTVESKYLFLLLLNITLLLMGCLMDIFSAILILLPLIIPLGTAYGIHPVHLGIIFIINMEVGFMTPPVGINLFLSAYRFGQTFTKICRYVLPFLLIQLVAVLIVTYVPWFSTFLLRFF